MEQTQKPKPFLQGGVRSFKYSVVKLIELVKMYPILWDCRHSSFRSFSAKDRAWKEIYVKLDDKYRSANDKTKAEIAARITGKWRNIRDAFIRSFKKRALDSRVKRYMYHDWLEFMLATMNTEDNHQSPQRRLSSNSESTTEHFAESYSSYEGNPDNVIVIKDEPEEEPIDCKVEIEEDEMAYFSSGHSNFVEGDDDFIDNYDEEVRCAKVRKIEDTSTQKEQHSHSQSLVVTNVEQTDHSIEQESKSVVLNESDINPAPLVDEDESFFASTLSMVKEMTPDEKLEFRMSVLQTIHQIRYRKRASEFKES